MVVVVDFLVFVYDIVDVELVLGDALIELAGLLEARLLYDMSYDTIIELYLPVLQPALKHLLGIGAVLHLRLLQGKTYLPFGTGALDNLQPLQLRLLVGGGVHLHRVAAVELCSQADVLAVNLSAYAGVSNLGMDVIGEVEHCGSLGELQQIALRGEHINLFVIEVALELVHDLEVVAGLQR